MRRASKAGQKGLCAGHMPRWDDVHEHRRDEDDADGDLLVEPRVPLTSAFFHDCLRLAADADAHNAANVRSGVRRSGPKSGPPWAV